MGKEQKKKGWIGFVVLAGICLCITIFVSYYFYYQFLFEKPDVLVFMSIFLFALLTISCISLRSRNKDIVIVCSIVSVVLLSSIVGTYTKNCQEEQMWQEINDIKLMIFIDESRWENEMEQRVFNAYQDYTNDSEMMDAFCTIRSICPFLEQQMLHMRSCIDILVNNITRYNYNRAYEQFILCNLMNLDYSENYTLYFNRFDELYEDLWYINYDSVSFSQFPSFKYYKEGEDFFLFAIRDDYDTDHDEGFEVLWFSDELHYFEQQLEYISGVLVEE